MSHLKLSFVIAIISTLANGAILSPATEAPPNEIREESGTKLPIYNVVKTSGGALTANRTTPLYRTGSGIREKTVFLIGSVNAYYATHYLDSSEGFKGKTDAPLSVIEKSKTRAIQLTFLRNIPANKITTSFTESLQENGIDIQDAAVQGVISKLNYDMTKGSTLTVLVMTKSEGVETIVVDGPQGVFSVEGAQLGQKFWKIWFGKPTDKGIERLKKELIGQS